MVTHAKISPKMVNPRDLAGNAPEEEEKEVMSLTCVTEPLFEVKMFKEFKLEPFISK